VLFHIIILLGCYRNCLTLLYYNMALRQSVIQIVEQDQPLGAVYSKIRALANKEWSIAW